MEFTGWPPASNLTKQPPLELDHLTKGCYLRLKVGAMDRGEREDYNKLKIILIGWIMEKLLQL